MTSRGIFNGRLTGIQHGTKRHFRELPGAVPIDLPALVSAHELIDKHFPKILTLTPQHEFLGIRLGRFEEIKLGIGDDADSLQSH